MTRNFLTAILCSVSFLASVGHAAAQADAVVQGVTERERLQQADLGIKFGSFLVLPDVDLELDHNDNVYAANTITQGDFFSTARIDTVLRSQFARHALNAEAYYERTTYFRLTTENTSQYGAALDGRYDLSAYGKITADGGYARVAEARSSLYSLNTATRPVLHDEYHGDVVAADAFGPLNVQLGGHVRRYDYHPALFGTLLVDQSDRNVTIIQGSLDVGYDLTYSTSVVAHGALERRRYDEHYGEPGFDLTTTDRSANGQRIEAGIQHQVNALIQATLRVGFLHYDYLDPRLRALSAFSYTGSLVWNVTPLTTIDATAQRSVDETVAINYAGNLRDEFHLGIQHELLRNLILLGDVRYAHIRPTAINGTVAAGELLAHSQEFEIGGGAHYYIGRYIRLNGLFNHLQRRSDSTLLAFSENVGTIGVTFSR